MAVATRATSKRMMACLVMSQSVGVIIGARSLASCATYHFLGQRKKSDPVVQHVIILRVASKAQIHLRCSAAREIDAGLRHFAHSTGGWIRRDQRPRDRPETFQTFPDVRAARADVPAQNRRALLQAVNIIRLSGTDVLGFELAHDIGDLTSIFDTEVEQRAARKREIL